MVTDGNQPHCGGSVYKCRIMVKNLPAIQETQVQSLDQEDPLEKGMEPTPVLLPGEPMDGGAWWATVRRVAKSWTPLSD